MNPSPGLPGSSAPMGCSVWGYACALVPHPRLETNSVGLSASGSRGASLAQPWGQWKELSLCQRPHGRRFMEALSQSAGTEEQDRDRPG